jgi:hypothetical protein
MTTVTKTVARTVNRGANPFAAIVKQQNAALTPANPASIYESAIVRGDRVAKNAKVKYEIASLKTRLGDQIYTQAHFGDLLLAPFSLVDLNIDIQRDEDAEHIAKDIIARFDPRICMPVMCTRLKNGRYSAWEGQQTTLALYVLWKAGLIDEQFLVQIKAYDETLVVPGTVLQGEGVGNLGFRVINGNGRKGVDEFSKHRSRVSGALVYGSVFREDLQSVKIQNVLQKNNMFPAKTADAAHNKATPGMVTYIHGLNNVAGHDKEDKVFDAGIKDLEWALKWHNTYYPNEKGVDGGFILAFGRLAAQARIKKIKLDANTEKDLYNLFRAKYGSPKGFHKDCKDRLKAFQKANNLAESWSDNCLTPILVMDYINWGGKCALPQVTGMTTYAGI